MSSRCGRGSLNLYRHLPSEELVGGVLVSLKPSAGRPCCRSDEPLLPGRPREGTVAAGDAESKQKTRTTEYQYVAPDGYDRSGELPWVKSGRCNRCPLSIGYTVGGVEGGVGMGEVEWVGERVE